MKKRDRASRGISAGFELLAGLGWGGHLISSGSPLAGVIVAFCVVALAMYILLASD